MESIKENKDNGKSFYKAVRMAMIEHIELINQLMGEEEEEDIDSESEEE